MLKSWLAAHWVASALTMAVMLVALAPLGIGDHSLPVMLIYLTLPGYMVHQVEEHSGDRFRRFVNQRMFGGVDALTVADVLWINLPGVWGVNLAALYATDFGHPGYGLAAPYLMLVNAIVHIVGAIRSRSYNPGLVTAVLLFVPLAIVSLFAIPAGPAEHWSGLAIAIVIHGLIIARVGLRAKALGALAG